LKRTIYDSLPTQTLREAAAFLGLRQSAGRGREALVERLAIRGRDSDVLGLSWRLRASELRAIATALGIEIHGKKRKDDLRLAVQGFVVDHSTGEKPESARDRIDDPLVLRTYRNHEPWIEVFQHRGEWLARVRIT
jgi:hypothetical protein